MKKWKATFWKTIYHPDPWMLLELGSGPKSERFEIVIEASSEEEAQQKAVAQEQKDPKLDPEIVLSKLEPLA